MTKKLELCDDENGEELDELQLEEKGIEICIENMSFEDSETEVKTNERFTVNVNRPL
jgi:hypothetical protein